MERGQEQSNMIGRKFKRWIILSYNKETSIRNGLDCYLCCCNCGIKRVVRGANLRNGNTRSCGCLNRENLKKSYKKRNYIGENNPAYYHGIYAERRKFRKTVRERDKVCQRCGKTQEKNGRELDAHHLDGNEYNNNSENGAALCIGCHNIVTNDNNIWRPK